MTVSQHRKQEIKEIHKFTRTLSNSRYPKSTSIIISVKCCFENIFHFLLHKNVLKNLHNFFFGVKCNKLLGKQVFARIKTKYLLQFEPYWNSTETFRNSSYKMTIFLPTNYWMWIVRGVNTKTQNEVYATFGSCIYCSSNCVSCQNMDSKNQFLSKVISFISVKTQNLAAILTLN